MDHLCGSACITPKARKHQSGGYNNNLDRWHNDDKYRKSLSDIGWSEEQIIQWNEMALKDHSYVATRLEKKEVGTISECRISAVTVKK